MGRRVNTCVDPYDYWLLTEITNSFEDFAVTFAHAFRYYIAGLIIGCFLILLLKKCHSGWTASGGFPWSFIYEVGDPNEENILEKDVDQEDGKGNIRIKQGSILDCCKQVDASRNPNALPSARETPTVVDYWKQCFDSFGYVVDNLNPGGPFRAHLDNCNIPHQSSITLRWEPSVDVPKSSKSSSTTDILRNVSAYSQVMSGELKRRNNLDNSVDTSDLENALTLRNSIPKRQNNKKLDTFDLRNLELNESDSAAFNRVRNDAVSIVRKKPKTTVLANTVKSSLIPGQKVSRNAVIILRLRDNCNVSNEERISVSSRKPLGSLSKNRTKKYSYFRTSAEKRKRREFLMNRKKSVHRIPSDDSSDSLDSLKNALSKNHLQCPISKKKNLLSCEKYKKPFKQIINTGGRKNSQQNHHLPKQSKPSHAGKGLQSQDFSKRQCFKYNDGTRKRQKIVDNASKSDFRSISRFFSELRKPNTSKIKQSIGSIWVRNNPSKKKDIYKVEVIESADGQRYRARSKCRLSENYDKSKTSVKIYNLKKKKYRPEQRPSETSCELDTEQICHIKNPSGISTVSVVIRDNQEDKSNKAEFTTYSDISTGSENFSSDEANSHLLPEQSEAEGKVEQLGDNCNKNSRSQFWKIFGSKNLGK